MKPARSLLATVLALVLMTQPGYAQESSIIVLESPGALCSSFNAPPAEEPGEVWTLDYIATLARNTSMKGYFLSPDLEHGTFEFGASGTQQIALWSNGSENKMVLFTTIAGDSVQFAASAGSAKGKRTYAKATSGHLHERPAKVERVGKKCQRDLLDPRHMTSPSKRVPRVDIAPDTVPLEKIFPRPDGVAAAPGALTETFPLAEPERKESIAETFRPPARRPDTPKTAEPEAVAEPVTNYACVEGDDAIVFPLNADLGLHAYSVGLRNDDATAKVFDFDRVTSTAFETDLTLDIADTAGLTLLFRPLGSQVAAAEGAAVVPVAVDAFDLTRVRASQGAASAVAYRIALFGAANDIAMSGLERLELEASDAESMPLEITWFEIDPNGRVVTETRHATFTALVQASLDKVSGDGLSSLTGTAFEDLLADIERRITAMPAPLSKVILVKGAYQVPSTIPALLESMLRRVNDGSQVTRGPTGKQTRWMWIVTARMPGFGVAYLKQPLATLESGEVIDEPADNPTEPRRLIVDFKTWSAKLAASVRMEAAASGAKVEAASTASVNDTLAVDRDSVFVRGGYLLSGEAVETLRRRLEQLILYVSTEDITALEAEVGHPAPSVSDIVASGPYLAGIRLPRPIPAWATVPVNNLSQGDRDAASQMAVALRAFLAERSADSECLTFVPAKEVGL